MRKVPGSFTAYDHTLRALHLMHKLDGEDFAAAGDLLRQAVADDPEFAMPHAWLARWHMLRIGQGRSGQFRDDMIQAGRAAERGTELDSNNSLALAHHGHVRSFLFHDYESGLLLFDRALAASPSNSIAWVLSAASLAYTGQGERAVRHAERGLQLSPLDRNVFLTYNILCLANYSRGQFGEAIRWGRRSLEQHPTYTATHRWLVGSLVADGQVDEARRIARAMLEHEPDFDLDRWRRTLQPFRDEAVARLHAERVAIGFMI
jgi:adenylate cyclase